MITTKKKLATLVITTALAILASLLIAYFNPSLIQVILIVLVSIVSIIFVFLSKDIGFTPALVVIGIALFSGFLGSFARVYDLGLLNNYIRWIPPLFLLVVGLLKIIAGRVEQKILGDIWLSASFPLGAFVLYSAVSIIYSPVPWVTLGRSVTFLAITFGLGFSLYSLIEQAGTELIAKLFQSIAIVMALLILPGELFLFFPDSAIAWDNAGRFRSTFWNPVTFAHLCVTFMPLYIWLALNSSKISLRVVSKIMVFILSLNIILTQSRAGLGGLIVTLLVTGWYITPKRHKSVFNILSIFGLITVIVLLAPNSARSFFTRDNNTDIETLTSGRAIRWQIATDQWRDSLWLGVGFGASGSNRELVSATVGDGFENELSRSTTSTAGLRFSNLYLEILATGGLIGLFLFLLAIMLIFHEIWNQLSSSISDDRVRGLLMLGLSTLISGMVLNFSETWIISAGSPFAMYWWLTVFLSMRLVSQKRNHLSFGSREIILRSRGKAPKIVRSHLQRHRRTHPKTKFTRRRRFTRLIDRIDF